MIRRHTAALAATAIAALSLTACGGEEGANIEEDPSTTVTPTGYDTDSPSGSSGSSGSDPEVKLPAAATKRTEEGAIAFNKFYIEQEGKALTTGETKTLSRLSHGCDACTGFIDLTNKAAKRGIVVDKDPYSISDIYARPLSNGSYRVEFNVKSEKHFEVDKKGDKVTEFAASKYKFIRETRWIDQGWSIVDSVQVK